MGHPYKIIVSSNSVHREFEIREDVERVSLGTNSSCEFRLNADDFFSPIEIAFIFKDDQWYVLCEEDLYLNFDDVRKLRHNKINHGDHFQVRYSENGAVVFDIYFSINFEVQIPEYNRKIDIPNGAEVKLGSAQFSPEVELKSEYCRDTLAVIRNDGNGCILEERKSSYGINVNGSRIDKPVSLKDHDFFSISDIFFYYKEGSLYVDDSRVFARGLPTEMLEQSTFKYPVFVRNTRRKAEPDNTPIKILDPSKKPTKPELNLLTSLLPMVLMLVMVVVVRGFLSSSGGSFIIFSACSMGLGIVTSIISMVQGQKKYKKDVAERERVYTKYIEEKKSEISKARQAETDILNEMYRSQNEMIDKVLSFDSDIFDRIPQDDDYMNVLLGYGKREAKRLIDYKKQEKLEEGDELTLIPEQVASDFKYIEKAPITISLRNANAVGITGTYEERYEFFKSILTDLICRQFSNEMEFFLLVGDDVERYEWIKRLPQLQRADGNRNIVFDSNTRTNTFDYLYKELSFRCESDKSMGKNLIVFTLDNNGIYNHPISKFIQNAANLKATFVFFENSIDFLPLYCSEVIELRGECNGTSYTSVNRTDAHDFAFSYISDERMSALVEKIAPIYSEEISLASSLRKNYTMYEMLGIYNADDIDLQKNWASSEVFKSMAAPLGINAKDEIISLDLHEKAHGPHGLVAGTTGSGKSEILQTYIMSMATKYHPYEVSFVIIDFKGGGMANQMADLPHLIGTITNIDGKEIDRSLKSIKAELLKRQALFAEAGVNHIDKYIKEFREGKVKIALPHLIIIVDEFAELKADQPEFMKELISASRIGRSLGVHLILATQKPSGQVNEQIWSNSRFKLCLKVQDQQDSKEVIKSPVAAEIKEPGRAYLQVGNNEIFELIQSGYSGGPAFRGGVEDKPFRIFTRSMSGKESILFDYIPPKNENVFDTELESVVKRIDNYCRESNIKRLDPICLPPLGDKINYVSHNNNGIGNKFNISIGVYDDPDSQTQDIVRLNTLEGNTLIVGSSQFGKTNLLQVITRGLCEAYTPNAVNIYVLDFASMALKVLEGLNHVGGVVVASEDERLKNFIRMMRSEIKERKERFAKIGITSFASYLETGEKEIPHIIIMVDNFIALKELYSEYDDDLLYLCREGISVGISLVITSLQTSGLNYRYMSNFSNRICLYCNQGDEYSTVFDHCRMEPKNVPGRGLVSIEKSVFEYQTYLAFEGEKEIDRVKAIKQFTEIINTEYPKHRAKSIPEVPKNLDYKYVKNSISALNIRQMQVPVGIDYDFVEFNTIDLDKVLTIGITGREGYGKTNLTKLFIRYLYDHIFDIPSSVYILDDFERDLEDLTTYGNVEKYTTDVSQLEEILERTEAELQLRMDLVKTSGISVLNQEPLILIVVHNNEIFGADTITKDTVETYKRIVKNYKNMKVCFIFSNIENENISYNAPEMMKQIKEFKYLLVLDDLSNLKLVDIGVATLREFKKPIELGDGYIVTEKDVRRTKFINLQGV